jgi:RNA polymerase sigma-70 factor (ECF subfamily)
MSSSAEATAAFLDAVDAAARPPLAADATLAARLERALEAARAAWPLLSLPPESFYAFLGRRVTTSEALERLHVADLYLTCAWLHGDPTALVALEAGPFADAAALLTRFHAPADVVEEAKQAARSLLFARDAGHAGIGSYGGRGPLRSWLGVVLAREVLQLFRKDRRLERFATAELVRLVDEDGDPEAQYLRSRYGETFRTAFSDALSSLDAAEKRLLRYSIVERLSIDDVSALSGVHRATAARRIAAARARLLDEARRLMKERLRVDTTELQSLLRACELELDVSVARLLDDAGAP